MWDVGKIVGVAAISLGLNHLIYELRKPKKSLPINEEQDDHFIAHEEIPQLKKLRTMQSINYDPPKFVG